MECLRTSGVREFIRHGGELAAEHATELKITRVVAQKRIGRIARFVPACWARISQRCVPLSNRQPHDVAGTARPYARDHGKRGRRIIEFKRTVASRQGRQQHRKTEKQNGVPKDLHRISKESGGRYVRFQESYPVRSRKNDGNFINGPIDFLEPCRSFAKPI